jgi:uncharacterized RDD family membrane protein YckC
VPPDAAAPPSPRLAVAGALTLRPQAGEDLGLTPAPEVRPAPIALAAVQPTRPLPALVGFGPRLLAGLVDAALVGSVQALLLSPGILYWRSRDLPADVPYLAIALSLALVPLAAGVGAFYYIHSWGARGATLGQQLLGLEVQGEDGTRPPGLARAFLRLLGYGLSACLFGLGFLLIAFGGRGLHDRIAGTRVVRRERS